jgi:hypothetical protein
MKTLLWLDDYRDPSKDDWMNFSPIGRECKVVWVKSYLEFVNYIVFNGLPDAICFDHDLGDNLILRSSIDYEDWWNLEEGREYSGMDCAKFLVNYCLDFSKPLPLYAIQSANPVGKENIDSLLKSFNKQFLKQ